MAVAANLMHGCGPSNEMRHQLQSKEDYGKAVLAINIAAKGIFCTVHY